MASAAEAVQWNVLMAADLNEDVDPRWPGEGRLGSPTGRQYSQSPIQWLQMLNHVVVGYLGWQLTPYPATHLFPCSTMGEMEG